MIPSVLNLRLQHLEASIIQILKLLNEYEEELLDEDDPGKISKYRRRIQNLKEQRDSSEKEFSELQFQLIDKESHQVKNISIQLKEIDNKIEFLLFNQTTIKQLLASHFNGEEQVLLTPVTQHLDAPELAEIQSFLEAIVSNKVSEEETQIMLNTVRHYLKDLESHNLTLPQGNESIIKMIISPKIDAKSALKISIPIIPFILRYEGELGLGTGINLRETWKYWQKKFQK
jgi:hypothetical protein